MAACNSGGMRKWNLPENGRRGSTPSFPAHVQKNLQRRGSLAPQPGDVRCVEIRATVQAHELASKQVDVGIEFE